MVSTNLLVLPAAASPQAHLVAYEELTLLRASLVPADVWRSCADNLLAAAAQVPAALAGKYRNARAVCLANAADMDAIFGVQQVVAVDVVGMVRAMAMAGAAS